jgi:hypothetical protein
VSYQDAGRLTLPGLDDATSAARYRYTDYVGTHHPDGFDYLIVANTKHAAVRPDPTIGLRSSARVAVPVSITYRDIDGNDHHMSLDSPLSGEPLPAPDGPVSIHFAAAPEDWWRTALTPVRIRPAKDIPWSESSDALAQTRPLLGVPSLLEFAVQTDYGAWVNEFRGLPIEFAAPLIPVRLPPWAVALLVISILLTVIAISRRVQERILILLGRRWAIRIRDADHVVEVRTEGNQIVIIRSGGMTPIPADPKLTFDLAGPILLPYAKPGENIRLRIESKELFVQSAWPRRVGSSWSFGKKALIAGQIAVLSMTEGEAAFAINGTPQKQLAFAGLGYSPATKVRVGNEGPWFRPLDGLNDEVRQIERIFGKWGADTHIDLKADRAALLRALRERDIVHVAAHAEHDFILLSDGPFAVADFRTLEPHEIRCRLIVLSACQGGLIKNPHASLAFQFVSRGMNMIGSTDPLDDFLPKLFFGDLYRAWLPDRRSGGVELATAIRRAAEALRHGNKAPRIELDALLLYGDPTLHFEFR